jgi:hypothetical protein
MVASISVAAERDLKDTVGLPHKITRISVSDHFCEKKCAENSFCKKFWRFIADN